MLPFSGGKDRIGEKKSTGGKGQGEEGGDNSRPGLGRKAEARAGEVNGKRKSDDGQDGIEAKGRSTGRKGKREEGGDNRRPGLRRKEEEQPGQSRERRGFLLRSGKRTPDSRAESVLRGEARERNKERRKNGRPLRSREKRQREKRVKIKSRGFGKQAICRR